MGMPNGEYQSRAKYYCFPLNPTVWKFEILYSEARDYSGTETRVYLQNGLVQILVQKLLTRGIIWTRNFGPAKSQVQKSSYLDQEIFENLRLVQLTFISR